jgi:hypothetical protein
MTWKQLRDYLNTVPDETLDGDILFMDDIGGYDIKIESVKLFPEDYDTFHKEGCLYLSVEYPFIDVESVNEVIEF